MSLGILSGLVSLKARAIAGAIGLAVLAAGGVGLWTWGYQVGGAHSETQHAKEQIAAVAAAHGLYVQRIEQGDRAALRMSERAMLAETALQRVKKEVRNAPITVAATVKPAATSATTLNPGPALCPTADDVEFTAGAVRLWNSALAGADVPAGACGIAGAPAAACDAGTGVRIADAHANAVENGTRFQACISRLNALIDLLEQRQSTTPTKEPTP